MYIYAHSIITRTYTRNIRTGTDQTPRDTLRAIIFDDGVSRVRARVKLFSRPEKTTWRVFQLIRRVYADGKVRSSPATDTGGSRSAASRIRKRFALPFSFVLSYVNSGCCDHRGVPIRSFNVFKRVFVRLKFTNNLFVSSTHYDRDGGGGGGVARFHRSLFFFLATSYTDAFRATDVLLTLSYTCVCDC